MVKYVETWKVWKIQINYWFQSQQNCEMYWKNNKKKYITIIFIDVHAKVRILKKNSIPMLVNLSKFKNKKCRQEEKNGEWIKNEL